MPSSFAWSQYKTTGKPIPGAQVCPTWAGGDGVTVYDTATELTIDRGAAPPPPAPPGLDSSWTQLKYTLGTDGSSIVADLAPLNGSVPTAIRYAWGIIDCNDYSDPDLWVTVSAAAAHSYHVVIPCPCVRSVLAERQNCLFLTHGLVLCCVQHGSVANCPIMSSSELPANPFMAKIVGGKCDCVAPQVC